MQDNMKTKEKFIKQLLSLEEEMEIDKNFKKELKKQYNKITKEIKKIDKGGIKNGKTNEII